MRPTKLIPYSSSDGCREIDKSLGGLLIMNAEGLLPKPYFARFDVEALLRSAADPSKLNRLRFAEAQLHPLVTFGQQALNIKQIAGLGSTPAGLRDKLKKELFHIETWPRTHL